MIRHRVIESPLPLGSPRAPARRRRAPSPAWRSTRPRPPRLPGPDRPGGMASPVLRMLDDPRQELHDELGRDEGRVLGGHVEHRVDLHEVEADHLGVARDREEPSRSSS